VKLAVYKNNNLIENFEIDEKKFKNVYIGRAVDCQIVLDDPKVSRYHALIYSDGEIVTIKKLTEFDSLLVNGKNVSDYIISKNDLIHIQDFQIRIEELDLVPSRPAEELTRVVPTSDFSSADASELTVQLTSSNDDDDKTVVENTNYDQTENRTSMTGSFGSTSETVIGDNQFDFNDGDEFLPQESGGLELEEEKTAIFREFVNHILIIKKSNGETQTVLIDEDEIIIGSDSSRCQILLEEAGVSASHAKIYLKDGSVILEDLNSDFGTFINENKIIKERLYNASSFNIGNTVFEIKISSGLKDGNSESLMPHESIEEVEKTGIIDNTISEEKKKKGKINLSGIIDRYKSLPPKKRLIYLGAIFMMVILLLDTEDQPDQKKVVKKEEKELDKKEETKEVDPVDKVLTEEEKEYLETHYLLAKSNLEKGDYKNALVELDYIRTVEPNYKRTQDLYSIAKEGLTRLEELEKRRKAEQERKLNQQKIGELMKKANAAFSEKKLQVTETLIGQILSIDPENSDVITLRLEVEAYKKDLEDKKLEENRRKTLRKQMMELLGPAKKHYFNKDWYKAILATEKFFRLKNIDDDLAKEASRILSESRKKINDLKQPLAKKAKSFKEGQDLKNAYETYMKILAIDPNDNDAHSGTSEIRETLDLRAKKIYREALISESISLFNDAKEKYQEVLQVAPSDSVYYSKAKKRLKDLFVE
jgi:pSer/pThr/pTyr-binding forkhead associated (FHA) protein